MAYYKLMIDNPFAYGKIFPPAPSTQRLTDDEVRTRYTAFTLLRLLDDWYIAHAHGSFPKSENDELWHAWDKAAKKILTDSAYLQELVRKNDYAFPKIKDIVPK
jgi:hypothetical protein